MFRAIMTIGVFLLAANTSLADNLAGRQKYWDGKVSPSIKGDKACKENLVKFAAENPEYMHPEMMAIGDSLFNGVQSLRINWWLSEWSPPVYVAIRMGLIKERWADRTGERSFYVPQYPGHAMSPSETHHYGVHLERPSYSFGDSFSFAINLGREQRKLLTDLLNHRPENNRAMVDNIAFSGASTLDLLYWTAADYKRYAQEDLRNMGTSLLPHIFLASAFTNTNAAFVLNPTNSPCLATFSALDHVIVRKPKNLLVNIGSNNGVYLSSLFGTKVGDPICKGYGGRRTSATGFPSCVSPISTFLKHQYKKDMTNIISKLSNVKGLEDVYINNLAKPSQTANLVPIKLGKKIHYRPAFLNENGRSNATINGEDVDDADKLTEEANVALQEMINSANKENFIKGSKQRFHYVDVGSRLATLDYKKCIFSKRPGCMERVVTVDSKRFSLPATQVFDNRPTKADGESGFLTGNNFALKIKEGGLFSLDNMHLSSIGYEIMADAISETMDQDGQRLPLPNSRPCRDGKDPLIARVQEGDCAGLLTTVGWSFGDATRRDFVFSRTAGSAEMRNSRFMRNLMAIFQ